MDNNTNTLMLSNVADLTRRKILISLVTVRQFDLAELDQS